MSSKIDVIITSNYYDILNYKIKYTSITFKKNFVIISFDKFNIKELDSFIVLLNKQKIHHIINNTEYRFFPESKHHCFFNKLNQMNDDEINNYLYNLEQFKISQLMEKI